VQDRYNAELKERSRSTVAFRRRTKHRREGDYWFGEVRDRI